jgi:hypothetical protein
MPTGTNTSAVATSPNDRPVAASTASPTRMKLASLYWNTAPGADTAGRSANRGIRSAGPRT